MVSSDVATEDQDGDGVSIRFTFYCTLITKEIGLMTKD